MERKAFTVNVPSEDLAKQADYFGMTSGRDVDKLSRAGLTPVKSELVDAPYVKEFTLILSAGCSILLRLVCTLSSSGRSWM